MGHWWVDSRIEAAVTRPFVLSQLLPDEIERLDRPVAFGGEDLTERTYWDSLCHDAPRLFLILVDLGVPDQIFGVIDDGWDDAELPIALEDVDRLQLAATRDERLDRKFYLRQFHYLLKPLSRGNHVDYTEHEVVPLDVIERPSLTTHKSNVIEKVKLPNVSGSIFCRRKYPLGQGSNATPISTFLEAIQSIKSLQNEHLVSYWASYTQKGFGYVLFTLPNDYTLKSFLGTTPSSFKNTPKKDRRELIMNWILCLVDTLCYLHSKNRAHSCIKPSTVLFTNQNHIFFSDSTQLTPSGILHHTDKASFDRERYDYAAPEEWFRSPGPSSPPGRFMNLGSPSTPPEEGDFSIMRSYDFTGSPAGMMVAPNPQLSLQQADIFSLGCIILELLSALVKRSSSKFAAFRSAKHKTAGRGGAVLDTSFHKNLGQVESWMSTLAKEASRKVSDKDGAYVFRGVSPMLHVVTGMLSANPYDRPPAIEVQQRIYQILIESCGIAEPHCVHQYSSDLDYALGQMHIQAPRDVMVGRAPPQRGSYGYGTPRSFPHSRNNSSGGYSQTSRTTSSSEADMEAMYNPGPSGPQRIRSQGHWAMNPAYLANPAMNQGSLYAAGP
ncbi:kinase-like domain-containing protein [Thelonectria olida]|uniref:Kinase-like domain-containing protein n=1 Tax=Thelonectria olida TaxID=1576542 RepID=A0A9P8W0D1_9HYPO|nr:kinase-like domain-containing protein [Thelonectria olida]